MKKRRKNKFQLIKRDRPNTKDDTGTVYVRVMLSNGRSQHTPGNILRSFTIRDAKVSEVAGAIEQALFGE